MKPGEDSVPNWASAAETLVRLRLWDLHRTSPQLQTHLRKGLSLHLILNLILIPLYSCKVYTTPSIWMETGPFVHSPDNYTKLQALVQDSWRILLCTSTHTHTHTHSLSHPKSTTLKEAIINVSCGTFTTHQTHQSFQINSLSAQGDPSERDFSSLKPPQENSEFETECK